MSIVGGKFHEQDQDGGLKLVSSRSLALPPSFVRLQGDKSGGCSAFKWIRFVSTSLALTHPHSLLESTPLGKYSLIGIVHFCL